MESLFFFLSIVLIIWWISDGKKEGKDVSRADTAMDRNQLRHYGFPHEVVERAEYEKARLKGEASEGFNRWRQEWRLIAAKESREKWLKEQSELGLLHRTTKRSQLKRDQNGQSGTQGAELGLLPEEADLYRRCMALNIQIRAIDAALYLDPSHRWDENQRERSTLAINQLDREWSALRATVEQDYFAAARQELDGKHRDRPYLAEFVLPTGERAYPWASGHWRVVSRDWARTIEIYDKEGSPIQAISPSLNGAVVSLFRKIDEARTNNRIRRRELTKGD